MLFPTTLSVKYVGRKCAKVKIAARIIHACYIITRVITIQMSEQFTAITWKWLNSPINSSNLHCGRREFYSRRSWRLLYLVTIWCEGIRLYGFGTNMRPKENKTYRQLEKGTQSYISVVSINKFIKYTPFSDVCNRLKRIGYYLIMSRLSKVTGERSSVIHTVTKVWNFEKFIYLRMQKCIDR